MTACARPGCGGSILDGYCDTCGLAPSKTSAASGRTQPSTGSRPVDVSRLTSRPSVSTRSSRRSRIGAGVVHITPVETVDPATVIMADPSVPESRRFCTSCDSPVGRGRNGQPGRQTGFCSRCGARFDFKAKLAESDVVAGQYEVAGPLAHGGLGWIYLARDRNVSDRWVVLKGLLDTADPAAAEAAVAERQFLAEVEHPAIVKIHNFVQHDGQGYIVMQYVGGPSVKEIAKRHRQAEAAPLPVPDAAAYLHAALPALGYLHDRGLLFCDFKPDNVIHVEDSVSLIDLGGVRRSDDRDSPIFGTYGYQAPEVAETGPTVASDLYTVGRSLAVLILDWPEWQSADRERLPDRDKHPILLEHDCLWRFLERACAPEPARRFQDAEEMAEALHGVLCQVAAAMDGTPRPRTSTRWSPPRLRLGTLDWRTLPVPLLPSHPRLPNRIAGVVDGRPRDTISLAPADQELSWADIAAVARAHCELGNHAVAQTALDRLAVVSDDEVELGTLVEAASVYLQGVVALAAEDTTQAVAGLDAAYAMAPGEAACAFAYAVALEATGDPRRLDEAAALYRQVAGADPTWVAAVAGLARCLVVLGRPEDAARVLTTVPDTHPLRAEALTLACQAMHDHAYDRSVGDAARHRLEAVHGDGRTPADAELAVALYRAGLAALHRGEDVGDILGPSRPVRSRDLALATEAALLDLADSTPDPNRRHELLDDAARTRPWSLF
jgi:serine/threonine-protein kinase PknG